jgi:hypothetical protein
MLKTSKVEQHHQDLLERITNEFRTFRSARNSPSSRTRTRVRALLPVSTVRCAAGSFGCARELARRAAARGPLMHPAPAPSLGGLCLSRAGRQTPSSRHRWTRRAGWRYMCGAQRHEFEFATPPCWACVSEF